MGFLDWIGGIADKFTNAIGLPFHPSTLISKASELLPVVANAVPGIGPILSKGLSAAQSIFGEHSGQASTTSTPAEESAQANASPPLDLSKIKETLSNTLSAINENRSLVKRKFDEENERFDKLDSRFSEIDSSIATLKSNLESMASDEHAAEERTRKQLDILRLAMEKSLLQSEKIKGSLSGFISLYLDGQKHQNRLELKQQHEKLADMVHPAIEYLQDNVEAFNRIKIQENDPSRITPYFDSTEGASLTQHCSSLQRGISNIRDYIRREIPTQEILDLYVSAVTWLLAYHKAIITLRSYLAHAHLAYHQTLEYTETILRWNDDLLHLVHDARENADFVLGKDRATKGRIEELADTRLSNIWSREQYEDDNLGHVTYFYDHYPSYGVGFKKLSFTEDRGDRGTIVIKTGHNDPKLLDDTVSAFREGYVGIQGATFTTATTAIVEMAGAWRNSADLWDSRMPFNPKETGPVVAEALKVKAALAKENTTQNGLGYRNGQYVSYGLSYVTTFGEGRIKWMENPMPIESPKGRRFVKVTLNPVQGVPDVSLDFLPKDRPHPAAGAAVVRRLYVKITGHAIEHKNVFHVADRVGLLSDSFTVLDQATGLYPKEEDGDDEDDE